MYVGLGVKILEVPRFTNGVRKEISIGVGNGGATGVIPPPPPHPLLFLATLLIILCIIILYYTLIDLTCPSPPEIISSTNEMSTTIMITDAYANTHIDTAGLLATAIKATLAGCTRERRISCQDIMI